MVDLSHLQPPTRYLRSEEGDTIKLTAWPDGVWLEVDAEDHEFGDRDQCIIVGYDIIDELIARLTEAKE